MANTAYYLFFTHNQLQYAVPATAVQEAFYLPQLNVIPEAPTDIIGSVNLRGEIIPVMDLNLRFGYPPTDYQLTDSIVILQWQELKLGIITNQIHEVESINTTQITPELTYDHPYLDLKQNRFLDGFLQADETLTMLLNLDKLLRYVDESDLSLEGDTDLFSLAGLDLEDEAASLDDFSLESPETPESETLEVDIAPIKHHTFWPDATEQQREVFLDRSVRLREALKLRDLTGLKPVSVFKLGQEFFGIDLPLIREFIDYKQIAPIPCTPNFVVGNINLRGGSDYII